MDDRGVVRPPYPTALRLYAIAAERWAEIDGLCAQNGVDPIRLRPDRFCNLIYAWAVERVEDRERFDFDLNAPMPGQVRQPSEAELEREGADFMSFLATHQAEASG